MIRHQPSLFFGRWRVLVIRQAIVALVIVIAGVLSPTIVGAADEDKAATQARFREVVPWLPKGGLPGGDLLAFEEHAHFVYLAGRPSASQESSQGDDRGGARIRLVFLRPATLVVDVWPSEAKGWGRGKPTAMSTVEVPLSSGKKSKRTVCVYHAPRQDKERKVDSIRIENKVCDVAITEGDRTFHLVLPLDLRETARITVKPRDGDTILLNRRLPAGVMPFGSEGMRLIERWDSRYRGDSRPAWDKGFPSSHLKAAVEGGQIKPGRAAVLGCGTGTNAIYLAKKGFDVTAIDIAPTALNLAQTKARKADVKVRWLLADVLAPPADLETFDFIFDRGCYHGVRRNNAEAYVKAVKRLSRPGTEILILAGNANEKRHYGPPRVKEEELRADFSSAFDFVRLDTVHFDSVDPKQQGALAWSVLLRRKAEKER
jgi:SAM-dependent methyltransferase